MKRFVSRGDVVWVKPNIGWDRTPEQAANTNPDVVATLIRLCFDAGAKTVKVGDNPCDAAQKATRPAASPRRPASWAPRSCSWTTAASRTAAIGGERVKSIPVYPEILDCDLVINVPIVKHHRLATATLCMKNYMGVIQKRHDVPPGDRRPASPT